MGVEGMNWDSGGSVKSVWEKVTDQNCVDFNMWLYLQTNAFSFHVLESK